MLNFKILFLTFILFNTLLFGQTIGATYDISFSLFGKLGNATTVLNKTDQSYYIRMEAKTEGLAKALSGNRQEVYESKGKVIDGILIPYEYKKTRSNNRYIKVKKFVFDHQNKKVILEKNEYYKDNKESNNSKEIYQFYAKNDILSLYFNILQLIKRSKKDTMIFHAIGGKEENGRIDIKRLQGDEKRNAADFLEEDSQNIILKVTINQKIFSSKNGELLISIAKDNLCSKAVLKDVILFGDIKGVKN